MRVSYEAKEEVGDGLKELNCHCERKHAQKNDHGWTDHKDRKAKTVVERRTCVND